MINIKYWKKSNGECGTMDLNGFVPDSIEIKEDEYRQYVVTHFAAETINKIVEYENVETGQILKLRRVK